MANRSNLEEKKVQEIINRRGMLAHELEELEEKQTEIQQIKKQKVKELQKLENEYSNILDKGEITNKDFFYCGKCQSNCKGLKKGYFH